MWDELAHCTNHEIWWNAIGRRVCYRTHDRLVIGCRNKQLLHVQTTIRQIWHEIVRLTSHMHPLLTILAWRHDQHFDWKATKSTCRCNPTNSRSAVTIKKLQPNQFNSFVSRMNHHTLVVRCMPWHVDLQKKQPIVCCHQTPCPVGSANSTNQILA